MSQPSDDLAARGRAIFRRLRAQGPDDGSPAEDLVEDAVPERAAPPSDPLTVVDGDVADDQPAGTTDPDAPPAPELSVVSEDPEPAAPSEAPSSQDEHQAGDTHEELPHGPAPEREHDVEDEPAAQDGDAAPAEPAPPDDHAAPAEPATQDAPAVPDEPAAPAEAAAAESEPSGDEAVGAPSAAGAGDAVPSDVAADPESEPEPAEGAGLPVDADEPGPLAASEPAPETSAGPAPGPLPGLQDLPDVSGLVDHDEPAPVPVPATASSATVSAPPPTEPAASPFARALPRVMAIANQKGGVGKTTTAVNLGACLADLGYRVLVVDLDPQGNASTGMGVNIRDLQGSMYDVVLHDLPIEDCVEATSVRNLFCAPSSLELAGAEIELVPAFSRELRLKRALDEVKDDYDFVLIDCPPSLGLLTVNAFAAATEVVVPIQCEYYALEGLGQLLRNVNLVQKNLNPALELSAIILVMYDARTKLADQVVTEVREHFGEKVCRQVVPRTVRLSEAPSFGQPIIAFDSSSRGAIAYRELAKEVSGGTPQRAR